MRLFLQVTVIPHVVFKLSLQEHHHISAGESFLIKLSSLTPPLYWPPEVQDEWFLQQLSHLDLPPKHLTLLVDVRGHVIRPHTPMVTKGSGLKQAVEEEPVQSAVSNAWVNTVALVDFGIGCRRNFGLGVWRGSRVNCETYFDWMQFPEDHSSTTLWCDWFKSAL